MPIFNDDTDKTGKRKVWTRDKDLSGLCLGGSLGLYSNGEDLASSDDNGRVILVRDEVADADFDRQLIHMYEAQQNELSRRFEDAKKVLRGEK